MVLDKGSRCAQACVIIFTLLFWISGLALLFLGIWMLVDPKRNYLLDLVNFSEDDPLLKFAAYLCLFVGCVTLVVGFVGCCGAMKGVRCMLVTFVLFLLVLFLAELSIGVLALIFKDKIAINLEKDLLRMIKKQYGLVPQSESAFNEATVTVVIDKLQFYHSCCGSSGPSDWMGSQWSLSPPPMGEERGVVPESCCVQALGATARNMRPRSFRCQHSSAGHEDRHMEGCHDKLKLWFDAHSLLFVAVGFSFAAFQLFGMIAAICLCRQIHDYTYI